VSTSGLQRPEEELRLPQGNGEDLKRRFTLGPFVEEVTGLAQCRAEMYQIGSIEWATLRFFASAHPPIV
jgi:hypothetical protein